MLVTVGSKNFAKIKAAKIVIKKLFPEAKVTSLSSPSGVNSQPMSDEEAIKGAINRAKYTLRISNADFAIGMEGGMHKISTKWFECGWIAVMNKNGKIGIGSSGKFQVPQKWAKEVLKGKELGEVIDEATARKDVRALEGAMGLVTNNHLPRAKAYTHGILFAFAPFISDPKFWN